MATMPDPNNGDRARLLFFRNASAALGVLCLAVSVGAAGLSTSALFYQSYLSAFLFWLQLCFGSTALLMIHFLTNGAWGKRARPVLEAASRTQWVLALLFVPVLLGIKKIYPWADDALMAADPHLAHKALYLNIPFFCLRAIFYFACWIVVSRLLRHWSRDGRGDILSDRLKNLSAGGLVLYGFTISFAAMDWQMSAEPLWYSTIYGLVFGASQLLAAWAFTLVALSRLAANQAAEVSPKLMRDLGNLLLTFVMFWAYVSFMQYLIVWSGNLPEEVTWAKHRVEHGWQYLALLIVAFQFALPFILLLFRSVKTRWDGLGLAALLVLAVSAADRYWQSAPSFHSHFYLDWFAVGNFVGIGGLWLAAFLGGVAHAK